MKCRAVMLQILAVVLLIVLLPESLTTAQEKQDKAQQKEDQEPTIKIGTTIVVVPVIVTDRFGRFVTGLSRNNFAVREDGAEQEIEQFSSIEAPFSVALLIDTSRSTLNKLGAIRKAALEFVKQLQPRDRVMIVTFDERVNFISDFSNNEGELKNAIKKVKTNYLTSLYDAVYLTITEKMNKVQGRKAIVVLTDGVDTASKRATFESVLDLVAASDIVSYAIQYETRNDGAPIMKPIFLPNGSSSFVSKFNEASFNWQEPQQNPNPEREKKEEPQPLINIPLPNTSVLGSGASQTTGTKPSTRVNSQAPQTLRDRYLIASDFLRALAAQSGALYMRAESIESTSYAFLRIATELRNQYTLAYTPGNEMRDGRFRSISVNVNANRDDIIVRSRIGYRAPKVSPEESGQEKKPANQSKP